MMRILRITQYRLASRFSRMTIHVEAHENGSGMVSGRIAKDHRRLALVEAYLGALPRRLWERGDAGHFVYAFGPRVLSRKRAIELNEIMDRSIPRRRGTTTRTKGHR